MIYCNFVFNKTQIKKKEKKIQIFVQKFAFRFLERSIRKGGISPRSVDFNNNKSLISLQPVTSIGV